MPQYFFKVPFASSGNVTTIPLTVQPGGEVSYAEGFGPDYQAASDDPDVLYPERPVINELYRALTDAMRILQSQGFPDWITSAANGGTPYSYDLNAICRHSGVNWISIAAANTAEPGTDLTKWIPFEMPQAFKTGMTIIHEDVNLPDSGWVWANGQTIGNAASGATGRANADTQALFTQIWAAFPNSVRPIQTSAGAPSTRGVSAAADFAANKRIPLRDMRDVVPAGTGTMGGTTDRGLLTAANTLGVDGTIFGATGGEELHTPTLTEMFAHNHNGTTGGTGLVANNVPDHYHLIAYNSTAPNNLPPQSTLLLGGTTGGANGALYLGLNGAIPGTGAGAEARYVLAGVNISPNVGRTGLQNASGAGTPHTHSIDSQGSSTPFNVVQPTTICNYITKL